MEKVKCPYCNQTLFLAKIAEVEIKCNRCKKIVNVKFQEQSDKGHIK